jgi:hypothetical protein
LKNVIEKRLFISGYCQLFLHLRLFLSLNIYQKNVNSLLPFCNQKINNMIFSAGAVFAQNQLIQVPEESY